MSLSSLRLFALPDRAARIFGAVLLLGGLAVAALAADEPRDPGAYRDLRHTMLARNALFRDPALAPLNLGVRVHNRVAYLWGPVPSAALKERAALVLRKLPDLLDVRNDLHVQEPDEPPPMFLPDRLPPPTLPGFSRDEGAGRGTFTSGQVGVRGFSSPADNVRLKPAPSAFAPDQDRPDTLVLPAIAVPGPGAALPLEQAVARVQRGDPRFQGLRAEVRDSQVRLSGTVNHLQDVYDFANALTRLPGVDRVIFEQVRAAPAGR